MARKTITLYIDDTSLRIIATHGQEITEWGECPLEPGLVENNIIIKEDEVAAAIKSLFRAHNIKGTRISLAISGFRCMTRPVALPKLPKQMLAEAVTREAQRTLPVSIDDLYLSWQAIPSKTEQMQFFFVGIPRKTADALFRTLRQARLKVGFMELKPLLLTRAVKDAEAIIIDAQETEFDIVVMVDGIPKVRTVQFPGAALSRDERLAAIKNELNRSITFYSTNNPDKPLGDAVPVFVSGNLAEDSESCQSMSEDLGRPVLPMQAPFELPEGFSLSRYMTNVCMALPPPRGKRATGVSVAALNTIPSAYRTRAVSPGNIVTIPAAVVAAGTLIFLVMFGQKLSDDIISLKTQVSTTNQLLLSKQIEQKKLTAKAAEMESQAGALTSARDNLSAALAVLERQAQATNTEIAIAMNSAPGNRTLTLTAIRNTGDVLALMGKATTERHVLAYIEELDSSRQFGNVVLTDMTRNEDKAIEFTIVGTVEATGIEVNKMKVALASLPNSVTLTLVNAGEDSITMDGTAPSAYRVFAYLRALEASGKFQEITIVNMTRTEQGGIEFSLRLKTGV